MVTKLKCIVDDKTLYPDITYWRLYDILRDSLDIDNTYYITDDCWKVTNYWKKLFEKVRVSDSFIIQWSKIYTQINIFTYEYIDRKIKEYNLLQIADIDVLDLWIEMLSKVITNKWEFHYKRFKKSN